MPNIDVAAIVALAQALQPIVGEAVVGVEHVIGAIKGAKPDAQVDDDLKALIVEALQAKSEADKEAAGG